MKIAYIKGDWEEQENAVVSINDSAFLLGDGLFETVRFEKDNIPFIDRHLFRLFTGINQLQYHFKYRLDKLVPNTVNLVFQDNASAYQL